MSTENEQLKEMILGYAEDLAGAFTYYDRKNDEELTQEALDNAIKGGVITPEEIALRFLAGLNATYKTEIQGNPLKRIDFEKGQFIANGKVYTIEGLISIERYAEFQLLEKELAYGFTVKGIAEKLQQMWNNGNKMKFSENAVIQNDLIRGMSKLMERTPTALKLCTLFINTQDEDRKAINDDMINEKINDWKKEGIAMQDFFMVASNSVNGLLEIYQTITRTISAQDENPAAGNP